MTDVLSLIHRADQSIRAEFAGIDITPSQQLVLRALLDLGSASQRVLVEATAIDRSTMSDVIRRLMAREMIKRVRNKKDARAYVVELTAKGTSHLIATAEAIDDAEKRLIERVPAELREAFISGLEHIASDQKRAMEVA